MSVEVTNCAVTKTVCEKLSLFQYVKPPSPIPTPSPFTSHAGPRPICRLVFQGVYFGTGLYLG